MMQGLFSSADHSTGQTAHDRAGTLTDRRAAQALGTGPRVEVQENYLKINFTKIYNF